VKSRHNQDWKISFRLLLSTAMPSHAMNFVRHATLCACTLVSACAIGDIDLVDQHLAADRHETATTGFAGRLGYVPRPLQPNNCGTPDTFKPCILAASRPEKPTVMIEELGSANADPLAHMSDALLDYSRLSVDHVVLPDR
jgi:hypothetical protein